MVAQHKEKGRSKRGKGESFTLQQLQVARDQYDEDATLCVFRLKSLKQGQARSLLTQAARHHAAQVFFLPPTSLKGIFFSSSISLMHTYNSSYSSFFVVS